LLHRSNPIWASTFLLSTIFFREYRLRTALLTPSALDKAAQIANADVGLTDGAVSGTIDQTVRNELGSSL
jgi:hypothetical protein